MNSYGTAFRIASRFGSSKPENPRVLLYSHDTYGLGHLRRNLAIAAHLLERDRPFSVTLLTGSPVAHSWPMPSGLRVQPLPPVIKTGAEEYASRDSSKSFSEVRAHRESVILDTLKEYRPDIFLVDHAPAGMKGELLPSLAFIRTYMPEVHVVLGLRDILDSPVAVRELWEKQGIYRLLRNHYDDILVYGTPRLFDAVREYALPPLVAARAYYCGYIVRETARSHSENVKRIDAAPKREAPKFLVTAGGGGDGYPMMTAYLQALTTIPHHAVTTTIVTGPLMQSEERCILEQAARQRPDVRLIPHTTELIDYICEADLIVAMCGYNTTAEILAARKASILVPRAKPRAEQRLRAARIGEMGLAWVVNPDEDPVSRLSDLLQAAVAGRRPPLADWNGIDLAGVYRVAYALEHMLPTSGLAREVNG